MRYKIKTKKIMNIAQINAELTVFLEKNGCSVLSDLSQNDQARMKSLFEKATLLIHASSNQEVLAEFSSFLERIHPYIEQEDLINTVRIAQEKIGIIKSKEIQTHATAEETPSRVIETENVTTLADSNFSRSISSFSEIRIELPEETSIEKFKEDVFTIPDYEFNIYIDNKKIHLQGEWIDHEQEGTPPTKEVKNAGAFGRIFLAIDPITQQKMAVKVAKPSAASGALEREAEALLAMQNAEHVVGAYVAGFAEGILFAVMEYIDGPTLLDRLMNPRLPSLAFQEKMSIILDIAKGINEIHQAGYIHKDIKLENIILQKVPNQRTEKARVVDFGCARKQNESTRYFQGSLMYMPPEVLSMALEKEDQIELYEKIDPKLKGVHTTAVDIYSFGVVLYAVLLEELPKILSSFNRERLFNNVPIPIIAFNRYSNVLTKKGKENLSKATGILMSLLPEARPPIQEIQKFLETFLPPSKF